MTQDKAIQNLKPHDFILLSLYFLRDHIITLVSDILEARFDYEINSKIYDFLAAEVLDYGPVLIWAFIYFKRLNIQPKELFIGTSLLSRRDFIHILTILLPLMFLSYGFAWLWSYPISLIYPDQMIEQLQEVSFVTADETDFPLLYNIMDTIDTIFLAPFLEELLFRGILFQLWRKMWGFTEGMILSSLLFAMIHDDIPGSLLFGIVMCLLYARTGSFLIPFVCHSTYNTLVTLWEVSWEYWQKDLWIPILQPIGLKIDIYQPFNETSFFLYANGWISILCLLIGIPWILWYLKKYWPNQESKSND